MASTPHRLSTSRANLSGAAVAGSVDSGKSTLVAVLTHGSGGRPLMDNGHGSARMAVFRHKHEVESGRTSSISQQTLGYNASGVPHPCAPCFASCPPTSNCVHDRIT